MALDKVKYINSNIMPKHHFGIYDIFGIGVGLLQKDRETVVILKVGVQNVQITL